MQNPGALYKIFPPCSQIFKSREGQNQAVFSVEKSSFLQNTVTLRLTNERPPLTSPRGELGLPVAAPRGCYGALIALQRGRRCNPTGTPLQPREGPVARRNPLFDLETAIKNPRSFAKSESRGALKGVCEAAGLSPLGESEGAFGGIKGLIGRANVREREFLSMLFCK